ncbi:hypothetical protein ACFL4F_04240 [Candidatus Margulisiibacteriota bacterium]
MKSKKVKKPGFFEKLFKNADEAMLKKAGFIKCGPSCSCKPEAPKKKEEDKKDDKCCS